LLEKGASYRSLRLEFTIGARDKLTISKEAFKAIIDGAISSSAPLAPERLDLLADLFATKSGTSVDYEAFLDAYAASQGMEKT
jgi:hypothetical protein